MRSGISDIAASLLQARKDKGLTQGELGKRTGLPQSHISRIESGVVDLQLSSLVEIARALDLEVKLLPRRALPAVEGAVKAVAGDDDSGATSRARAEIQKELQLVERVQKVHPRIPEIDSYSEALKKTLAMRFDNSSLNILQNAFKASPNMANLLDSANVGSSARLLITSSILRNKLDGVWAHVPQNNAQLQQPAYRLEDDE